MTNEELILRQIRALEEHTDALKAQTAALYEQADAAKKLERTLHLIFEDKDGYINSAADSKLRGLTNVAEQMREAASIMRAAAADYDKASRRARY